MMFTCSGVSIRQETSSSSWSLSFQSGIRKASSQFRLSATQIQIGRLSKFKKSTSGLLASVFNVNLQSTSRTHASIAHSSAESELYAMTHAAVESLAIKNFIQEFSSAILSSPFSIVIQTDSSGQIGAQGHRNSLPPVRRRSHEICSSINFRSTSSSFEYLQGQFPKVSKISSAFRKQVQYSPHPQPPSTSSITPTTVSIFMFPFNNYDHQEALRHRFRQASRSINRLLTPPHRGSGDQGD